jgi:hypothetical protein
METAHPAAKGFTPPYNLAFSTFNNFLAKADPETLPPKIDRSYLDSMAGNVQTYLMAALRSFELIGPDRTVTPELKELTKNPDGRPAMIAELLNKFYPEIVELGKSNATALQLEEAFRKFGLAGNTIRKAATFYLHAAQYAGVPLSVHWAVRKAGSGHRDETATKRQRTKPSNKTAAHGHQTVKTPVGDSRSLALRSGGTVTLAVSVNLFDLSKEDRAFVLKLIDEMSDYDLEAGKQPQKGLRSEDPGPNRVVSDGSIPEG